MSFKKNVLKEKAEWDLFDSQYHKTLTFKILIPKFLGMLDLQRIIIFKNLLAKFC